MTYTLTLRLGAWLNRYVINSETPLTPGFTPDTQSKYAYHWTGSEPQTPESILKQLGIPLTEVGIITADNGRIDLNTPLTSGSVVTFYPVIVGG